MGCALTKTEDEHNSVQAPVLQWEDFHVFVPGIRLPKKLEFPDLHRELSTTSRNLIERLMDVRTRVVFAAEELVFPRKLRRKRSGLNLLGLREAIEEYLPVLLKLLKNEVGLADQILFTWTNQEDEIKETSIHSPYYEILSVLQLLATLSLIEANKALVFKPAGVEGSQHKQILDDNKKTAMDVLFKAAEVLECALKSVLPQAPRDVRDQLPADLTKGVLQALQLQALGQTVEIQLGLAIDNSKATMAVKRRLACEELKYWQQAYENLQAVNHLGNGWGEKHLLFIKWKKAEAKAAAFHFHGLILNEGADKKRAAASLGASEHFFKESERMCEEFSATAPMTRSLVGKSQSWGPMKYLSDKIPAGGDVVVSRLDHFDDKIIDKLRLPDFPLALQVDEYVIPIAIDDDEDRPDLDIAAAAAVTVEEEEKAAPALLAV